MSSGNSAAAHYALQVATPGIWSITPDPIGPFDGPATQGTVSTALVAHTRGFDLDASSSTGDVWQQTVDPNAPAFTPVTLAPGGQGRLTLTLTPSGRKDERARDAVRRCVLEHAGPRRRLVALPYEYTVS